ncbi:hypothetical protein [Pseudogemmobacter bohemicus]|uniref:hypothetical protein n=1 Tax=Pseudogemmobacter bohemicus TaxID=2250708 RepID=UPI000DD2ED5C|nr:hypothetical protein [Pseudogemmobacter bohemicus]
MTGSFWRSRKTAQLNGQEAIDGSRYQVVIDDAVVLRIDARGDCLEETMGAPAATAFYKALTGHDFSRFRRE